MKTIIEALVSKQVLSPASSEMVYDLLDSPYVIKVYHSGYGEYLAVLLLNRVYLQQ